MARQPRQSLSNQLSTLGAALQAMRKQKGLSQEALAKRTGDIQSHISAIEKGAVNPSASTLIALASALGAEWLLIPKNQIGTARRLTTPGTKPGAPASILDEVYVPEPEEEDNAG